MQEVLHWQTCTIKMMYGIVAAALQDVGSQEHPQDYLAFFCLGAPPAFPNPLRICLQALHTMTFLQYSSTRI